MVLGTHTNHYFRKLNRKDGHFCKIVSRETGNGDIYDNGMLVSDGYEHEVYWEGEKIGIESTLGKALALARPRYEQERASWKPLDDEDDVDGT